MKEFFRKYRSIGAWFMIIIPVVFVISTMVILNQTRDSKARVASNEILTDHLKELASIFQYIAINSDVQDYSDPMVERKMSFQARNIAESINEARTFSRTYHSDINTQISSLDSLSELIWKYKGKLMNPALNNQRVETLENNVKETAVRAIDITGTLITRINTDTIAISSRLNDLWKVLVYLLLAACGLAALLIGALVLYMDKSYRQRKAEESLVESEARNRALVDAIPDMMFRIDSHGNYLDFKPAANTKIISPSKYIGRNVENYLTARQTRIALDAFKEVIKTGQVKSVEYDVEFRGKVYELEARIVKSGDNEVIATIRDITERKRIEKALAVSRERYELAVGAGNVGVWDWSIDTNELYIDPLIKKMLGYKEEEIGNYLKDWQLHIHPDDIEPIMEVTNMGIRGEKPAFSLEHRMIHRSGRIIWLLSNGIAMKDQHGKPHRIIGTATNITRIKEVEYKLAESEATWRSIFENVEEIVIRIDRLGKVQSINKVSQGFSMNEIVGKDLFGFLIPNEQEWAKKGVMQVFEKRIPFRYDLEFEGADGSIIWYSSVATPVVNHGQVDSVIIVCRDVTENKLAQEALKANERRLSLALETAKMGNWDWDLVTEEVKWSEKAEELFGFEPGSMKNSYEAYLAVVHPDQVDYVDEEIKSTLKTEKEYVIEHRILLPDFSTAWLYCKGQVIHDESGMPVRLIGTIMDITQLKEAEIALINAVIEGQDVERKRIAEELHDSVGQVLSSISMNFNVLKTKLSDGKMVKGNDENVENIQNLVSLAVSEVRTISHNLMPDLLEEFGLVPALKNMVAKLQNLKVIQMDLEVINVHERFDPNIEIAIYRITQELINNIIKHAQATSASIQLINHGDSVVLMVQDDGIGYDVNSKSKGIGLRNITSRAKLLNAELIVDSSENNGTEVTLEIPLVKVIAEARTG